jgi:hypothetical protein
MTTTVTTINPGHRPGIRSSRGAGALPPAPAPLPVPNPKLAGYHDALMRLTVASGAAAEAVAVSPADLRVLIAKVHADHAAAKTAEQVRTVAA